MDEERLKQELTSTLKELKDFLKAMTDQTGTREIISSGRPTEGFSKTTLEIVQRILAQKKECVQECKDRVGIACYDFSKELRRLEEDLKKSKEKLFAVDEEAKATKTTTGRVTNFESDISLLKNSKIEVEKWRDLVDKWIELHDQKEQKTEQGSRFKFTAVLTVISISVALLFGIGGFVLNLIKLVSG